MSHVFVIMMENTSYDDLLSPSNQNTKFIQQLAANNGLANNYFGVTHDSLPNYIAATSGQTWGSNSDDTAQAPLFNHQNLVDQLEAAHVSWKAYMENLPFPGDLIDETSDGLYVRKHDPFLMYPDVYNNPARADNVVPLDATAHRPGLGQCAAVRLDQPEHLRRHARRGDRLPVPQLADRPPAGRAVSGRRQLPAQVGAG